MDTTHPEDTTTIGSETDPQSSAGLDLTSVLTVEPQTSSTTVTAIATLAPPTAGAGAAGTTTWVDAMGGPWKARFALTVVGVGVGICCAYYLCKAYRMWRRRRRRARNALKDAEEQRAGEPGVVFQNDPDDPNADDAVSIPESMARRRTSRSPTPEASEESPGEASSEQPDSQAQNEVQINVEVHPRSPSSVSVQAKLQEGSRHRHVPDRDEDMA